MRRLLTLGLAASLMASSLVAAAPAHAQFSPRDAKQMCKDAVRARGATDTTGVNVDALGRSKYNVTGYAQRHNSSAYFTCRVNRGDVRHVEIDRWQHGGGSGGGGKTAAAVIGTALVLGAIAAAASSDKRSSDYDRYDEYRYGDRPDYDQYSPAPGIVCYRWQRTCYKNGSYAPGWTSREFGY
ncbi:MAG: hypothetical protein AB7O49_17490 [Sphingomonadales bacterium]